MKAVIEDCRDLVMKVQTDVSKEMETMNKKVVDIQ